MNRRPRLSILIVLACALYLRVLVPFGWMPAADGPLFAIQPCIAAAPVPAAVHAMDHHGMHSHHGSSHQHKHGDTCPFAPLAGSFTPPVEAGGLVAPALMASAAPGRIAAPFFPTGPPAPPPPATGPPIDT